jgi:hypothetical protein
MKKSVLLLTATLLLLSSVSPVFALGPSARHDTDHSATTWFIAVSGSGVLIPSFPPYSSNPNSLNFNVKGWCLFTETSSRAVGYCSLTRSVSSASGGYSCEGNFYITAWHAAAAFKGPPVTDFIMDSGTVAVSPASTTSTCAHLLLVAGGYNLAPTGTPGLLTISAPSDSHFPTTPGYYTTGAGPVNWSDFNLVVRQFSLQ